MNKKFTILHPPSIDLCYMFQRPQQMMKAFANLGHTVYYCQEHLVEGRPNTEMIPNLHTVYDLKFLPKEFDIVWSGNPMQYKKIDQYGGKFIVYDCCDDFYDFWGKREDIMTRKADIIMVTAQNIWDRKVKEKGEDKVFLIQNGVDPSVFKLKDTENKPEDLDTSKPIIGYTGALADWVDWDLVERVADEMQDWNVVLIGPELCLIQSKLKKKQNIKWLGMKPYPQLPSYTHYFDVCMIPFKLNKITQATNPVKVYEYLSLGKPIVATKMKELHAFKDVMSLSESNDFIFSILKEYKENSEEKVKNRVEKVKEDTWINRAKKSMEIIETLL